MGVKAQSSRGGGGIEGQETREVRWDMDCDGVQSSFPPPPSSRAALGGLQELGGRGWGLGVGGEGSRRSKANEGGSDAVLSFLR